MGAILALFRWAGAITAEAAERGSRIKAMTALTTLGRVFDATVAIAFVVLGLTVAGATAVVGV